MSIILALVAFSTSIIAHAIILRLPLEIDSVTRFLMVGMPIGLVLVLVSFNYFGFQLSGFVPILLYAFLCELYLFCFTLVISSVSVAIMIMLKDYPVEILELCKSYSPRDMVQLRINRLIETQFLKKQDKKIQLTEKGKKINFIFFYLNRFFRFD